jgi:hypothetical protein
MLGHVPKRGEQFKFIRAGHEFDRPGLGAGLFKIFGEKQHLPVLRVRIQHGDADDLRGEWPEIELLPDFGAFGFTGRLVGDLFGLAEKVFLLRLVKSIGRQRGSLNVENNGGHVDGLVLEELGRLGNQIIIRVADDFDAPISTPLKNVSRPPSSRPSPQGEGESYAGSLKYLRLDLPDGHPQNQNRTVLSLLLSAFAFGFGAIASKRSEDGGEKVRLRAS